MKQGASIPTVFDAVKFHQDVLKAGRELGVTSAKKLAADAGVEYQSLRRIGRGLTPSVATLLQLCSWAGMNPLDYMVEVAPEAANDSHERKAA